MKDEIELKLDAPPAVLDRLRRHPAIRAHRQGRATTRTLDNTYYDTPDFALASAGASLRVRRIGRTRLQTLKLRNGTDDGSLFDRREWEAPLPGEAPDAASLAATPLPDLFPADTLTALRPLFMTRFRRTTYRLAGDAPEPPSDGGPADPGWEIELTLDIGTIEAEDRCTPLAEAELELVRGTPRDLYRLARTLCDGQPVRLGIRSKADRGYDLLRAAAPAVPKSPKPALKKGMTAIEGFQAIGRSCLTHYLGAEAALHHDRPPEAIHQMRVALRRLRSAMSLFGPLVATAESDRLKTEVKWLANALGDARDLDVFLAEVLKPVRADLPQDTGLAALADRIEAQRDAAYDRAFEAAETPRAAMLLLDMALWLESGDWLETAGAEGHRPLAGLARDILDRRARKVAKKGRHFHRLDPERRHRVRIEVKKLRYAVDFFRPLFAGKRGKTYQKTLARLQDSLGVLNDLAVAHRLLHDSTVGPVAPGGRAGRDQAFAAGMILGWHEAAAHRTTGEAEAAWTVFAAAPLFWR